MSTGQGGRGSTSEVHRQARRTAAATHRTAPLPYHAIVGSTRNGVASGDDDAATERLVAAAREDLWPPQARNHPRRSRIAIVSGSNASTTGAPGGPVQENAEPSRATGVALADWQLLAPSVQWPKALH
jgi:hypothetical protein